MEYYVIGNNKKTIYVGTVTPTNADVKEVYIKEAVNTWSKSIVTENIKHQLVVAYKVKTLKKFSTLNEAKIFCR